MKAPMRFIVAALLGAFTHWVVQGYMLVTWEKASVVGQSTSDGIRVLWTILSFPVVPLARLVLGEWGQMHAFGPLLVCNSLVWGILIAVLIQILWRRRPHSQTTQQGQRSGNSTVS